VPRWRDVRAGGCGMWMVRGVALVVIRTSQ
jgi:hypothetical protein